MLKRIRECLPNGAGKPRVLRVSDVVDVEYCPDSADTSFISSKTLKIIGEHAVQFEQNPVECKLPGGKKTWAHEMTKLSLSLVTAASPVNSGKPVTCLILENNDDEVLLGDGVLKMLVIDVGRQLELLAAPSGDDREGDDEEPDVVTDSNTSDDIRKAVGLMIERAVQEGIVVRKIERLRTTVCAYDVRRLVLGDDPPADVEPMRVHMKAGCKPFKAKVRKYAQQYQAFLESFNDMLVQFGCVYENATSRWDCAAVPLCKRGGGEFRQTVDYKPLNPQTEPMSGLIPNLRVDLENVRGSRHFRLFDFINGY
ncbi:hypothetical protein ON010_g18407 [Phytophthora cinnamomi]|nr:hypothetical protein ON010_g18407 [Phytophthora cinnamomi]